MFSAFRSSLRRTYRQQRSVVATFQARRAYSSTGARLPKRSVWIPVAVGTVTLSAALLLNKTVRLDAGEDTKVKQKPKAKKQKQESESEPQPEPQPEAEAEELLRKKEEQAKAESSHASSNTGKEGEAEGNEEDSSEGGAFNPETGEINWDCPCLGGMAHGPCGQEFRDAFSCFVFSEDEPKGINCVEKFKLMQDCFRRHPEVYGEEIMRDDDDDDEGTAPSGTDLPGLEGEHAPEPAAVPPPGSAPSSS